MGLSCEPNMYVSWSVSELRVNLFKPSSKIFYWPFPGGTSFVDLLCVFSVFCLLCLCDRLFIDALWSPAGKGLAFWLSFVVYNCEFVTFPLVSKKTFCGFSRGSNQYWAGGCMVVCVFMTGTPEGSTESGFMKKPGIDPATPGLQGIARIHYTTGASPGSGAVLDCIDSRSLHPYFITFFY